MPMIFPPEMAMASAEGAAGFPVEMRPTTSVSADAAAGDFLA
jgi:hypothetical protein